MTTKDHIEWQHVVQSLKNKEQMSDTGQQQRQGTQVQRARQVPTTPPSPFLGLPSARRRRAALVTTCSAASRDRRTALLRLNLDSKAAVQLNTEATVCFMQGRRGGRRGHWKAKLPPAGQRGNANHGGAHAQASGCLARSTALPSRNRRGSLPPSSAPFYCSGSSHSVVQTDEEYHPTERRG